MLFIGYRHGGQQVPSLPPHLLASLQLVVLGCGKFMVPLEVLHSGLQSCKSGDQGLGLYTRGYLGIVDEEKLGIGQVQSRQPLIFATFSQPL